MTQNNDAPANISIRGLQNLIREMYFEKDSQRGTAGTFMWLMEEIGELSTALRSGTPEEIRGEFADVIAWLVTIANIVDCDLTAALAEKYGGGCPGCGQFVCECSDAEKP
ncbi:MAG: nucleotide pyrophosphohydrolase [Planctomycetaceae bacterium]|jgi:NTP pyrophosphatase (non-canonical NTP hydrolase)|nr:nucleotide pyrophosphohydrolase [Planctomycetaceae bacterium]